MRQSQLFGRTVRETPADAEIPSHQLLIRAGLIRQLSSGLYTLLPLAQRSARKIEAVIREEMDRIGGQEINMPLVQPADLWRESGRYQQMAGKELLAFADHNGREHVLAMTHEEAVTSHARGEINSYRQLPLMVYQLKLKFRDELRPRAGLIRVREFTMKDAYSFHTSEEDLDAFYMRTYDAYARIFARCGVPATVVESDPGMIGGTAAHEFMHVTPSGEDRLILCPTGDYTANAEVAAFDKGRLDFGPTAEREEVATPDCETIDEVADFLGVPTAQTIKAVLYVADGEFVFAAIRGDLDVNEVKLANALGAVELRPATEEEIRAAGAEPGYASPIGLDDDVKVVADDSVEALANGVAGANRPGYHLRNVNYGRDFTATVVDIALAQDGHTCAVCGAALEAANGIEVGNIFKLGTKYSESMGATYLDATGRQQSLIMGCYGIGVGRLLAAAVEASHDDDGISFPVAIAPYEVHLVPVGKGAEVVEAADALYEQWSSEGYEVLYDDRKESPGVKFKDSDLIGLPLRVTLSQRTLGDDAYEVKCRWKADREIVPKDGFSPRTYLDEAWAHMIDIPAPVSPD
ncbi:proline--tRNA ligase [Candidatus Poribacteria bacterium]|jgi:prolyl-tRNA synthetase|nr:proline--tRNA ligase [Candidatus Poribacteria bacterium]MBT5711293.1 proline--tRNA ligase [Candidatus Poribacteria bacterium]MBT7095868.1 proline--tRNA ligase [Candidatus Poribacteria bacterium]MBT7809194.1 proline--tRNA ligase [Candidatus Poribacteria bacterium]